ncbi:type III-B CRISPR-associated protein Cas10/Cmr2 (plasmid) [Euhalothece natronophila Z-M001]|uniref:Type III-B CRISPR-associated protein Cas10/Cmr2 n=1 Tax=Euhalothece natronophila Z-M001 TaxID=522448 RepID=A0A5B8NQJ8_9CHRO|nr:type III-B CRISPR-associated protein Cas10/Cmr2 [Euhalothece natronophila]QDZ41603.1 type III-B CRISPR-associated protein Cas10/Cmr2 [Euhalothece natronophila Z-M001]
MIRRKLYALIQTYSTSGNSICSQLHCLEGHLEELQQWWNVNRLSQDIASSSDRVNLETDQEPQQIKHPISGQSQRLSGEKADHLPDLTSIAQESDPEKVFWWFWRFFPEAQVNPNQQAFLPAHAVLPDCPLYSYSSTVSALVGAMNSETGTPQHPYLLLFTFSPVQEFIKASRKFLDFWAGSYLLHYLGAKIAWEIAQQYGPDAVITPSLWSQEIIDALLQQKYPDFETFFQEYTGNDPVSRFNDQESTSLSTAGFPNMITAVVPGEKAAQELGDHLKQTLNITWTGIGEKVRETIKNRVMTALDTAEKRQNLWTAIKDEFSENPELYRQELEKWQQGGCWEWNRLWNAQLEHTWEPYWTAIPLGSPEMGLEISLQDEAFSQWREQQDQLSQTRQTIPTTAETNVYENINIGTWWGSLQQRLGQSIQAVKNTRTWAIPASPGERSTLSGHYSAVHPNLLYKDHFREGGGLAGGSMRLFWRVIAEVFPGLFNGSEKLNALELTKRMAWVYGGVGESLGIKTRETTQEETPNYEQAIRFPNLSSIAAARFAHNHPEKVKSYWHTLEPLIRSYFSRKQRDRFGSLTRRPFQVPKVDQVFDKNNPFNGVMFSSKWLGDDLNLTTEQEKAELQNCIDQAHQENGFGNSSPADWWVIVLGDGDGMGQYVSGRKLEFYESYLDTNVISPEVQQTQGYEELLHQTKKRMGPATHVGLNRALLDFSNRLVPYLTQERCCGKVIYSGGDDVMTVLPIEDLSLFLRSLRAAWCGGNDPIGEFDDSPDDNASDSCGYWYPKQDQDIPLVNRPYFTMGKGATMSLGIVIAHKSVPLPTVLQNLWSAESDRAKELAGAKETQKQETIPPKDGLCFRVIYGSGNVLESLMKGHLLDAWCDLLENAPPQAFSGLLYRLAEELPKRCPVTPNLKLFREATQVILNRRDQGLDQEQSEQLLNWLDQWEDWAYRANPSKDPNIIGTTPEDLGKILRFTAFWVTRLEERQKWTGE